MTSTTRDHVERFDAAVARADVDAALAVVSGLLGTGLDPVTVMVDVIAPVQTRVGQRWQSGVWSVAQEHAATSVAVSALEAVARATQPPGRSRGRVVIACAEREWHAVPAMIVAGALRATGWQTMLLGASTPTVRLSRYLQDLGPDVTAVSCSVAAGLPNARGFIEASTTAGIPVLAGGAAFGPDSLRADRLGATAWAADARGAADAIEGLPLVVPAAPPLPADLCREVAALRTTHEQVVDEALRRTGVAPAAVDGEDPMRESLDQAVHSVAGAVLTDDPRLLGDTAGWVSDVLRARGYDDPDATVRAALVQAMREYPRAAAMVRDHWPDVAPRSA
jgi:methanogenic corrinoid protein MtbC1